MLNAFSYMRRLVQLIQLWLGGQTARSCPMATGRTPRPRTDPNPGIEMSLKWIVWLALSWSAASLAEETPAERQKPSLHEAIEQVRRDTGGRILSAETVGHGKNQAYRIKVLTPQGSVRVVQIPTRKE